MWLCSGQIGEQVDFWTPITTNQWLTANQYILVAHRGTAPIRKLDFIVIARLLVSLSQILKISVYHG